MIHTWFVIDLGPPTEQDLFTSTSTENKKIRPRNRGTTSLDAMDEMGAYGIADVEGTI